MTVLLAVIAELLVDDPAPQLRCRRELAERGEHLPRWITALPRVDVYRAVCRTNVFGDLDELVIGMRLRGGRRTGDRRYALQRRQHSVEVALDAPDLLRAFVPYAHAHTGIRHELTSQTLAKVDSAANQAVPLGR